MSRRPEGKVKFKDLPVETVAKVKELYEGGLPQYLICQRLGLSKHFVMRILKPEQWNQTLSWQSKSRTSMVVGGKQVRIYLYASKERKRPVPDSIFIERDKALDFERTPNHVHLGDPPPLRSALYRKATV